MKTASPKAYHFTSSARFVAAYDRWARESGKGYSQRAFARWAGISSPNFLSLIISGKRSLSGTWLSRFIKAAKLETTEARYLELLVELENSKDTQKRGEILKSMHSLLDQSSIVSLVGDRLSLLRNPAAWTIYHMLSLHRETTSEKWFKERLRNKLSVPEIRSALQILERLGLIKKKADGSISSVAANLESPDQITSAENADFHRFVLDEAKTQLNEMFPDERAFGSLTIALSKDEEEAFKSEVSRFGKSLLKKYGKPGPVQGEIFRLNIQLYPLTHTEKKS